MASRQPMELLCQELTCPVCLYYFKDPVILDCGHNICRGCLTRHQRGFGMSACCPQCPDGDRLETFRPNWQLTRVVELVKKLQGGERAEPQMCAKHQEPLEFFCKEDWAPVCEVCRRSKEHHGLSVHPREEEEEEKVATKVSKVNCSKAGTHRKAIQYLKMRETELMELCQEKGLDMEGFSVDELRIIFIQQASQPEADTMRLNAKGTQVCGPELKAQRNGGEPRESRQFKMLRKRQKEQLTAQAEETKNQLERLYLKEKQAAKPIPWVFPSFSPGKNPAVFLAAFERTIKQWNMSVKNSMRYLPCLIRGELAEMYHTMPSQKPITLQAFKEAVFKKFSFDPDLSCEEFWALKPQLGTSLLKFGAKLEEMLNWWLDTAKADDREKVVQLVALNQFYSHLPDDIKLSVKAKAPKTISQAAEIADQLMPSQEDSEGTSPHLRRDKSQVFRTSETTEGPTRTEIGLSSVEYKMCVNVTNTQQFKKRACYNCGKMGHLKTSCPSSSKRVYRVSTFYISGEELSPTGPSMESVLLGDKLMVVLLSSGASISLLRSDLVSPFDIVPGESVVVESLQCTYSSHPVASLQLNWRHTKDLVDFGVVDNLFVPVIIGIDLLCRNRVVFSASSSGFTVNPFE